jgi:hypothetical protein
MASIDLFMHRIQVPDEGEALKVDIEKYSPVLQRLGRFIPYRNLASFGSVGGISGEQYVEISDGRWCGEDNVKWL